MLYPISQSSTINRAVYKNAVSNSHRMQSNIIFRENDTVYADEMRQKKNRKNWWLAILFAYIASGMFLSLWLLTKEKNKALTGRRMIGQAEKREIKPFQTLINDIKVPTLENCKSINKKLKEILETKMTYKNSDEELLRECGMPQSSNRFIFYGDPGNGKTFFTKIYAKTIGAEYKEIESNDFRSQYPSLTLKNLGNLFEDAIKTAKENPKKDYVLVLNEADQLIFSAEKLKDTSGGYGFFRMEERDVFINYLDRLKNEAPNVTFIGTVNFTPTDGALDSAILSRFSKNLIEVPYPETNALYEALKASLKTLANSDEIISKNDKQLKEIAQQMEERKCSFRNLDDIIDIAKDINLKNRTKDRSRQFEVQYISDALNKLEYTDGEISVAQKLNNRKAG